MCNASGKNIVHDEDYLLVLEVVIQSEEKHLAWPFPPLLELGYYLHALPQQFSQPTSVTNASVKVDRWITEDAQGQE